MRRLTRVLLAGASAWWPCAALAIQTTDQSVPMTSAPATAADPALPVPPQASPGDIIVVGQGQTRQVQQLSQGDIAILPPGTSPLKAVAKLPNVNFQSADAFGAYEWSERVSIRSFNQNQIGFTLDGIQAAVRGNAERHLWS